MYFSARKQENRNAANTLLAFSISFLRRSCGPLNVLCVLLVFLADVFHQFFARHETRGECHLEWFGVGAGIIDRDFIN